MVLALYIIFAVIIVVVVFILLRKRELRLRKKLAQMDVKNVSEPTYYADSTRSKILKDFKRIQRNTNRENL